MAPSIPVEGTGAYPVIAMEERQKGVTKQSKPDMYSVLALWQIDELC